MKFRRYIQVLYFGLIITLLATSCQMKTGDNFDGAYVHSVYFWLKNPNNETDRASFEKSLLKFLQNSKYAKTNYLGTPPKAVRAVVDDSFTYNLIVTFESDEAQANYQDEAAHKLFIEESSSLWNKVVVYDSRTIGK